MPDTPVHPWPPDPGIRLTGMRRSVLWFLAAFFVVVLGILVTLALNFWSTDRRERAHENALLLGLRTEIAANLDLYDASPAQRRESIEQARRLLAHTGPDPADVEPQVLDELVFPLISTTPSFHPAMGEVETRLGAGHPGLIQTDELRAAIAGWPGAQALLRETEYEMRTDVLRGFFAYMVDHLPLVTMDYRVGFIDAAGPSRFSQDYAGQLADVALENDVVNRWVMARFIFQHGESVRDLLSRIRDLIDGLLADSGK